MPWKFPKRLPRQDNVVDYRDLNDGLMPVVEEDGRLNETNINEDLATQLNREADLQDDVSFRIAHLQDFIDCSDLYDGKPGWPGVPDVLYADKGWQVIPAAALYDAITDQPGTLSYTFRSYGGDIYIYATFQFSVGAISITDLMYTKFGVRVDGAVLPISVIGDQDLGASGPTMESGISGRTMGVCIDHSISLNPGVHTIEIVADPRAMKAQDKDLRACFYSKELLIWEIR